MYEQAGCLLFLLCSFRLGEILHGNAFAGVCFDARSLRYLGDFHIPDKAIVDYDSLCSDFAGARYFVYINAFNELLQQRGCDFIHLNEFPDGGDELFFPELHFIHF